MRVALVPAERPFINRLHCPACSRNQVSSHFSPAVAGNGSNIRGQGCRGAIHRTRLPTCRTLGDVPKL